MGRLSYARSLSVWSNGERVSNWTTPARGDSPFLYDRAWRESALDRPLSLSLPYTGGMPLRGAVVSDYLDNLQLDSEPIRKRLASHYKLASTDAFDLLQEIGRDCVGAVPLLKEDEVPIDVKRIEGMPMREKDVERHLIGRTQPQPAGASGYSASGASPAGSTHRAPGSCACHRKLFCQPQGVPPYLKYESDGGPVLAEPVAVLGGLERAEEDPTTLLTSQVLFWLLAAPDGHAEKFSIKLLAGGRYQLTPLYDVESNWTIERGGANQYALHKARVAMALLGKKQALSLRGRAATTLQQHRWQALSAGSCGRGD